MISNKIIENTPIDSSQNTPLELLGQWGRGNRLKRRYTRAQQIQDLAISNYNKNGKAITYHDLISNRLARNKPQAQNILKRCLRREILFTPEKHKPQQYYPTCLKSEISRAKMSKSIPIGVTGVGFSDASHYFSVNINNVKSNNNNHSNHYNESLVAIQSLEGYVLPLLPSAPLFIHKIQFKLKITPECYDELHDLRVDNGNKGKEHVEVIGNVRVSYRFYANGTVMVFTESSNNPFKLEDDIDRSSLIAFFGQVRDRLVTFVADIHERIIPDIMQWELTQCDINKDIQVGEALQYNGIKVQVKHFDHLFRVYIKSIGKDTACRVEKSLSPKKPALQAINEIFCNPNDREYQQQPHQSCSIINDGSREKINQIHGKVKSLFDMHKRDPSIVGHRLEEQGRS